MSEKRQKRIGVIGYGQIGSSLYELMSEDLAGDMQVIGINESNSEIAAKITPDLFQPTVAGLLALKPDLVVEAAHPEAVLRYGETALRQCDLMIMSVSALGDKSLEDRLRQIGRENGTILYIPHGATLGLDGLRDGLSLWEEVAITMRKNPRNLNFSAAPQLKPGQDGGEVILYDGPTRGVLPLFPKNVNSHATLALATLGMDKTRSILISDPSLDESVIEIDAHGGGTRIHIERRNPIKGVTGKLTIFSVLQSIRNILGQSDVVRPC